MPRALIAIFFTLAIDSMGMGFIVPILPALIRDVDHVRTTGWQFGALLSLYAAMQFLFAPLLGSLSEGYGRRPLLLISIFGAAVDYVFMAFAPLSIRLLYFATRIALLGLVWVLAAAIYLASLPFLRKAVVKSKFQQVNT